MVVSYKVFLIPGINEKTVSDKVVCDEGITLSRLMDHILQKHGIDLRRHSEYMPLLDGAVISLKDNERNKLEKDSELVVLPMISGG